MGAPMRIWMHLVLSAAAMFAGFFAGAIVTALLLELIRDGPRWVVIPTISVAMVAFVIAGLRTGEWVVRRLPARCPPCRGAAWAEGHRPVRFRCRTCGHVHRTKFRTNWGSD